MPPVIEQGKEDEPEQVAPTSYKQRQCGCLWILYLIGGMIDSIPSINTLINNYCNRTSKF